MRKARNCPSYKNLYHEALDQVRELESKIEDLEDEEEYWSLPPKPSTPKPRVIDAPVGSTIIINLG